jgi:SAM-dependent methyltransferase
MREPCSADQNVATAYNGAGRNYGRYADGEAADLFAFSGLHGYADRQVWGVLDAKLCALRASGAAELRVLDAGCGPGTWLRRIVQRAEELGFVRVKARGFDIAAVQIAAARNASRALTGLSGIDLRFQVDDLLSPLPETDNSVDIVLCLYSVLSHLPKAALPKVLAELARVTKGCFVATVRSVGSAPTIFVDTPDKARTIRLDHEHDRCEIEFRNGARMDVPFHLFSTDEFQDAASLHFAVDDISGLDIFHSRFVSDRGWNPDWVSADDRFLRVLADLEHNLGHDPILRDHATHILFVGKQK